MHNMRDKLRALTVLSGCENTQFNPEATPDNPEELFIAWLDNAIDSGVSEPHAMVLSTVDESGNPDARTLILKNIDTRGWYFAISNNSPKGRNIESHDHVALTFYWKSLARQIRVKGRAVVMDDATNHHDFLSRSKSARAMAMIGKQSEPLQSTNDLSLAHQRKSAYLDNNSDHVLQQWKVYCVEPSRVEFWQGHQSRNHIRLLYQRKDNHRYQKQRLWP